MWCLIQVMEIASLGRLDIADGLVEDQLFEELAMNPVYHPRGGGEGRSKSSGGWGKGSRTPWGKPTKGGFKTGPLKRRK